MPSLVSVGKFMRPKRVGASFTPDKLSNLAAWWKADSLSLNDGDPVSTWTDSSASGRNATGVTTERPTYKVNIINSKPALLFNGTTNILSFTALTGSAMTGFVVGYQNDAGPSSNGSIWLGSTTSTSMYFITRNTDFLQLGTVGGSLSEVAGTGFQTWAVNEFFKSGSTQNVAYNGTYGGAPSSDALDLHFDRTGYPVAGNFYFITGYVAEIVLYSASLTNPQKSQVRSYLGAKYGITVI